MHADSVWAEADTRRWACDVLAAVESDGGVACRRRTGDAVSLSPGGDAPVRVTRWLYNDVHLRGEIADDGEAMSLSHAAWQALTAGTATRYTSDGWKIEPGPDRRFRASRNGLELLVPEEDAGLWMEGDGRLRLVRYRPNALFGWHVFIGRLGGPVRSSVRLYLPELAGPEPLVALVNSLDDSDIVWSGKLAANEGSRRPDRLVLYLDAEAVDDIVRTVHEVRESFEPFPTRAPGFAVDVRDGVPGALGTDDGAGRSHGMTVASGFARALCGLAPRSAADAALARVLDRSGVPR